MRSAFAACPLVVALVLSVAACKSKPPRQAEAPDALADKGADMSTGAEPGADVKSDPNEKSGAEKMREKCCGQCKAALASDRSGSKPDAVPCTDYTAGLDPFCLEYFRGKKTMASECK
jgi:hypothetical protein